jgi:ABC-type multidrug transport system fused ATPase/permease subunit
MIGGANGAYVGLLTLLSFGLSVLAAVCAIDMYTLTRTGEYGKTWRVLIIASVMFAFVQVLRIAELLNWQALTYYHFSEIVEMMFVMALAYAFFLQRRAFHHAMTLRRDGERRSGPRVMPRGAASAEKAQSVRDEEWSRLSGRHAIARDENSVPRHSGLSDADDDIEWSSGTARHLTS